MMKRFTLLTLAAAALLAARADYVTPEEALARLNAPGLRRLAPMAQRYALQQQSQFPELYIFAAPGGYMVLPADDCAAPLLGYSDDATADLSNPALAWWLETYNAEIAAAKGAARGSNPLMRASRPAIEPMIATRWNQEAPYNDLCPELNGTRCPTGCVATAMAQVMRYHSWPDKGTGSHSYSWNGSTLSFDFGATTFDWSAMTDRYDASSTEAAKKAVATLMYAAGVSVDMQYTASESGAVSREMGTALTSYFGYDRGLWMANRDYYGLNEWEELVYAELSEGRPVLYGGTGSAGGHQFVCDGYSADGYFHFNWGWGGMSDGYFLLTALDPPSLGVGGGAGGFNYNQNVLLGVRKPVSVSGSEPTYLMYCSAFVPASSTATLGSAAEFGSGFFNYSYFATPADTRIGVRVESVTGRVAPLYLTALTSSIEPEYGVRAIRVTFPTDLAQGTYKLTPVYQIPGGDWQLMRAPLSANASLTATVSGSTVMFTEPDSPRISVSDLTAASALYWGSQFKLTFTVTNSGETEYYGGLTPTLITADGSEAVAASSTYPVDLEAGDSDHAVYTGTFSAQYEPEAGTYLLGLVNADGSLVGDPIEVTLNAQPAQTTVRVTSFTLQSQTPMPGDSPVKFRIEAECTEGYFADGLTVAIFHASGGTSLTAATTETLYIAAGESAATEASVNVSTLPTGNYMAAVFKGGTQLSQPVYFAINEALAITEITAAEATASGPLYDLLGRPAGSATRGLLITPTGSRLLRH